MSSHGPTHSLASIAPDLRAPAISPPGVVTTVAPIRRNTSAPSPGIRYRSPLKSSGLLISLLNHPPICTPVFNAINGFTLKGSATSSHNTCPPPKMIHEDNSSAVNPQGTAL